MTSIIASFLVLTPWLADMANADEVQNAIADLGNIDFMQRENATEALVAMGEPVLDKMAMLYLDSDDPEVRARARRVAWLIYPDLPKGFLGIEYRLAQMGGGEHVRCVVNVVNNVQVDTPAAKAGLQKNDVIEAIDGQRFKGSLEYWTAEFRFRIQSIRPGTRIELTVSRGAQLLKLPLTVGQPSKQQMQSIMRSQSVDRWWDTVLERVLSRRQNDLPAVPPE